MAIRPIGDHPPVQSIGLYHPLRNVTFNLFEMFIRIIDHGTRRYNALARIFLDHPRQRRRASDLAYLIKKFHSRDVKLSNCRIAPIDIENYTE